MCSGASGRRVKPVPDKKGNNSCGLGKAEMRETCLLTASGSAGSNIFGPPFLVGEGGAPGGKPPGAFCKLVGLRADCAMRF